MDMTPIHKEYGELALKKSVRINFFLAKLRNRIYTAGFIQ